MVGTEYVLLRAIELCAKLNFEWNANKNKKQSCPHPVENSCYPELAGEKYRN